LFLLKFFANIVKCDLKDATNCEYNDGQVGIPKICGSSKDTGSNPVYYATKLQMQNILKNLLENVEPPISCPVIKKV
jgi:hypothetical protein